MHVVNGYNILQAFGEEYERIELNLEIHEHVKLTQILSVVNIASREILFLLIYFLFHFDAEGGIPG